MLKPYYKQYTYSKNGTTTSTKTTTTNHLNNNINNIIIDNSFRKYEKLSN